MGKGGVSGAHAASTAQPTRKQRSHKGFGQKTRAGANRFNRLTQPFWLFLFIPGKQPGRRTRSGVSLGLENLAATVKTGCADVVTQVDFACGGFHGRTWRHQSIVRTVHATLGRRFFVLLNGHEELRVSELEQPAVCQTTPLPANQIRI
jgi:hypothetical protein